MLLMLLAPSPIYHVLCLGVKIAAFFGELRAVLPSFSGRLFLNNTKLRGDVDEVQPFTRRQKISWMPEFHHAGKAWQPKEYGIGAVRREGINDLGDEQLVRSGSKQTPKRKKRF
jgi:hypothetical protein